MYNLYVLFHNLENKKVEYKVLVYDIHVVEKKNKKKNITKNVKYVIVRN
jgi:hypothetical protein